MLVFSHVEWTQSQLIKAWWTNRDDGDLSKAIGDVLVEQGSSRIRFNSLILQKPAKSKVK